jgi:hypothetical protein
MGPLTKKDNPYKNVFVPALESGQRISRSCSNKTENSKDRFFQKPLRNRNIRQNKLYFAPDAISCQKSEHHYFRH